MYTTVSRIVLIQCLSLQNCISFQPKSDVSMSMYKLKQ